MKVLELLEEAQAEVFAEKREEAKRILKDLMVGIEVIRNRLISAELEFEEFLLAEVDSVEI